VGDAEGFELVEAIGVLGVTVDVVGLEGGEVLLDGGCHGCDADRLQSGESPI
jgi:hypothetical protein